MIKMLCALGAAGILGIQVQPAASAETPSSSGQLSIPYVPTRHDTLKDLLWVAEVGTNDVVYDLGSGDGRVVIAAVRDRGARKAVGIELDPKLVQESRENARQAGVADRVQFIHGDLFTNDFSDATVVVLYLGHAPNLQLRPKLLQTLKPGARIVSHQFGMGEWMPEKNLRVRTTWLGMVGSVENPFAKNPNVPAYNPEYDYRARADVISTWVVPAPIAGVWRGKISIKGVERELKLTLHQRLTDSLSSFEVTGVTNRSGYLTTDLWGDHLRFDAYNNLMFDGYVRGDTMQGKLALFENGETREVQWEAKRDKADFTGTWEWTGPASRPVQLRIERRDGRLGAIYADPGRDGKIGGDREVSVEDLYDFGGGFYFTLLIGKTRDGSVRVDDETGWLIGEAIASEGGLTGTIAFYSYQRKQPNEPGVYDGVKQWQPKRLP